MQLFLCEKPSQARDIAKVLGITQRGEGCLVGNNIIVTWCIGHLLEAAPPESYNQVYKKWTLHDLPIAPLHWKMVIKPQTSSQFKVVKKLLSQTSELVIATDADREGEMIARELLDHCAYKGKILRLWLSALNDASIRKALGALKQSSETITMYYSALTRSRSDWLIGMNMSRLFTLLGQHAGYDGVLSVGRVQTPTLALVVKRDREIANFIPKPYWTITVSLNFSNTPFLATWQVPEEISDEAGRCINETVVQRVAIALNKTQYAHVTSVEVERVKEVQPLVFDLGTLQEICSKKFGFGAQETLDIAQSLYETHKATTYPRSDCGYLPESMYTEVTTVLNALAKTDPAITSVLSQLDFKLKSRVWNDKKITAHHGIIPTLEPVNLSAMSEKELAVYTLIRSYYLAQFLPHHEYDRTVIMFSCANEQLKATGKQIVTQGWHSIFKEQPTNEELKETKTQVLPSLLQGAQCDVVNVETHHLKTTPPKHFTEGELIKAMKGIAKYVSDPRLKQTLKESTGIGTEATRAGIIKTLQQRGYIINKGKAVHATDAAFTVIDAVPPAITDPGMTALWEQALESIEHGEMTMETFLSKQISWITQLVNQYSQTKLAIKPAKTPSCPICNSAMRKRKGKSEFWGCSKYPECNGIKDIGKKAKSKRK